MKNYRDMILDRLLEEFKENVEKKDDYDIIQNMESLLFGLNNSVTQGKLNVLWDEMSKRADKFKGI